MKNYCSGVFLHLTQAFNWYSKLARFLIENAISSITQLVAMEILSHLTSKYKQEYLKQMIYNETSVTSYIYKAVIPNSENTH